MRSNGIGFACDVLNVASSFTVSVLLRSVFIICFIICSERVGVFVVASVAVFLETLLALSVSLAGYALSRNEPKEWFCDMSSFSPGIKENK